MARCPNCDRDMTEVSARANPGQLIVLDQCPGCGGIWCDRWELFPIAPDEAPRIESLNEELLRSVTPVKMETLYCPRCRDRLQPFKEPLLPLEIQLHRCRRCDGIWLNRGIFSRFKQWQKKTRKEKIAADDTVWRVVENYSDPKKWVTTGTRGIFAYPRGEDDGGDLPAETARGALKLILQALLRLVWPL